MTKRIYFVIVNEYGQVYREDEEFTWVNGKLRGRRFEAYDAAEKKLDELEVEGVYQIDKIFVKTL